MEQYEHLSLAEIKDLIHNLKALYHKKYHNTYKIVEVVSFSGNISDQIGKETGFNTYHHLESYTNKGTVGANRIEIPIEKYSEELKEKLLKSYDMG